MSADGAGGGMKQRFELYIKASAIDKETKGSCPICQHWFMITCLLGENQDDIDFKVYTVQADCPPKNFGVEQGWSKKFPVVMVLEGRDKKGQDLTGTKYDTFEELETFFESINRESKELKRKNAPNVAAMKAVEDVYNAFNTSLNTGKVSKRLKSEFKKINEFLESDDEKFLVDDVLSFADCYLLPRLQHIRVAGKEYLEDFDDIPKEFTAIWQYLANAYQTEAFRSTMPSDQDIIFHYEKKATNAMQRLKRRPRPTLQNFSYTLDVPEDISRMLQAIGASANGDVGEPPAPADDVAAMDITQQQQQEVVDFSPQEQDEVVDVSPQQQEEVVDISPQQQEEVVVAVSQQEEVAAVSQQEVVVSADAYEAAADGGVADDGIAVEQAYVQVASHEEAVVETPAAAEEAADEVVRPDEAVVTQAPPAVDDTDAGDTAVTEESQTAETCAVEEAAVTVDTGGGDDDAAVTTVNTDTAADAVPDDDTPQVNNNAAEDNAVGVKIVVGQVEDDVKIVGNGDVVGQKEDTVPQDNVVIIKTDDGVVNAE